ncbi:FeoB-associated Cys-rich membrane protein [Brevibacillus sp. SYSU BS000544]
MIDILIGSLVFGYAGWTIYRYVKKSKQGSCSGCAHTTSCGVTDCSEQK